MLFITSSLITALILDRVFGEPNRFHPLVMWGRFANVIEKQLNRSEGLQTKVLGTIAWLVAVMLPALLVLLIINALATSGQVELQWLLSSLCLYSAIGWQSLREHGLAVGEALQIDIESARQAVSRIVSRNTEAMDQPAVIRGVMESLLENGADAIFAAVFWYVVAGPFGVVVYRLSNTLDAMWGYRTDRFNHFGWFSAKVDDVLNWIPARLTALSYACLGQRAAAIYCWRKQAPQCASPNGGPVMCAGAGSLMVLLGGPTMYHGEWHNKTVMGCGNEPQPKDIGRAIKLIDRAVFSWAWVLIVVTLLFLFLGDVFLGSVFLGYEVNVFA